MLTHLNHATLMTVITIVTLNINGLMAPTRVGMLSNFLRQHDIDILFAQEVTSTEVLHIQGYTTYHNVGASMRGTALLARKGIQIDSIVVSPTGRAMAASFQGVLLISVYAPSGTAMRAEREQFFNSELPPLLRADYKHIICGGDFSCVLHPIYVLGHLTRSYALAELVKGFDLRDTWT